MPLQIVSTAWEGTTLNTTVVLLPQSLQVLQELDWVFDRVEDVVWSLDGCSRVNGMFVRDREGTNLQAKRTTRVLAFGS